MQSRAHESRVLTGLRLTPALTPHGRLLLAPSDDAGELEATLAHRLERAFARGAGHGLLRLGAAEVDETLPPAFSYWRRLGRRPTPPLSTPPPPQPQPPQLH